MSKISMLRAIVNKGWTIANRRAIYSQIGKANFEEIAQLAAKSGRCGNVVRYTDAKDFLLADSFVVTREALTNTNLAYHGSPFSFNCFDASKIGQGEGMNKYCKGLYLARTKKIAPFYANIRSKDAPIHFGCTKKLENPVPTVYTVGNIDNLNLKLCTNIEAKDIRKIQSEFQRLHPEIDGIELLNGEITVFPESIHKLNITDRSGVVDFVRNNKNYPFRTWTTDQELLNSIYGYA